MFRRLLHGAQKSAELFSAMSFEALLDGCVACGKKCDRVDCKMREQWTDEISARHENDSERRAENRSERCPRDARSEMKQAERERREDHAAHRNEGAAKKYLFGEAGRGRHENDLSGRHLFGFRRKLAGERAPFDRSLRPNSCANYKYHCGNGATEKAQKNGRGAAEPEPRGGDQRVVADEPCSKCRN